MIGLDTPVLLRLLRGDGSSKALLKRLEGEEVCTTAINLFELEALARLDGSPGREQRVAALDRLRRKITILPIEERGSGLAAAHAAKEPGSAAHGTSWLILGALEANGCTEWLTDPSSAFPRASKSVKVSIIAGKPSRK